MNSLLKNCSIYSVKATRKSFLSISNVELHWHILQSQIRSLAEMHALQKSFPSSYQIIRLYEYLIDQISTQSIEKEIVQFTTRIYIVIPANFHTKPTHLLKTPSAIEVGNYFLTQWKVLSAYVGNETIENIWNSFFVFQKLPNGSFVQLNCFMQRPGKPFSVQKSTSSFLFEKKRIFYAKPASFSSSSIGSAVFVRFVIFYKKISHVERLLEMIFGREKVPKFILHQRSLFAQIQKRIDSVPVVHYLNRYCGTVAEVYQKLGFVEPSSQQLTQQDWIYERMVDFESVDASKMQIEWCKVFLFCRAVLLKVFGWKLFGRRNWNLIFRNLRKFLVLKKSESLSMMEIEKKIL